MGTQLREALLDALPEADRAGLREGLADINFTDLSLQLLDRSIFKRSLRAIDEQFGQQPLVQAELLETLAATMESLGMLKLALDPARRAMGIRLTELGREHHESLVGMSYYGSLLVRNGRFDEAEPLVRTAYEDGQKILGAHHPAFRVLAMRMGHFCHESRRLDKAEGVFRQLLDASLSGRAEDALTEANLKAKLGAVLLEKGDVEEAEILLRSAYATRHELLGDSDPQTLYLQSHLCVLLRRTERYGEAADLYDSLLTKQQQVLGSNHPATLQTQGNLAGLYFGTGDFKRAAGAYRRLLETRIGLSGEHHPSVITTTENLGACSVELGQATEAEAQVSFALSSTIRQGVCSAI